MIWHMQVDNALSRLEYNTLFASLEELVRDYITIGVPWYQSHPVIVSHDDVVNREWIILRPIMPLGNYCIIELFLQFYSSNMNRYVIYCLKTILRFTRWSLQYSLSLS